MKNLCAIIIGLFLLICCGWSHSVYGVHADFPETGIDGSSAIVNIWRVFDATTSRYQIRANYNSGASIDLTHLANADTSFPFLAVSTDPIASTRAIAIWKALDLSTSHEVIQVTIATSSGWTHPILTISLNDGTETALDHYKASISSNGEEISVIWPSSKSNGEVGIRQCISRNGGLSWTSPISLY